MELMRLTISLKHITKKKKTERQKIFMIPFLRTYVHRAISVHHLFSVGTDGAMEFRPYILG